MKKLLLLLLPAFAAAQQKMPVEINTNFRDATRSVGSVTVIDARADKNLGTFTNDKDTYEFYFAENPETAIKSKFDKDNKVKGTRNLVLLLEEVKMFENATGKKTVPDAHIIASTFEKKGDQYFLLHSINKNAGYAEIDNTKSPKLIGYYISQDFTDLMKASYAKKAMPQPVSEAQLRDYRSVLSANLPAFTGTLADGVYETYGDFFAQKPASGFTLERNAEGKVVRAKNGDAKIPATRIFAYVENGKAYKNTFSGFMPMERNDKGYYLVANKGELEAVASNSTYGMFGLVGGIAGAIDQSNRQSKAKKQDKKEVYVDPFSGGYIY